MPRRIPKNSAHADRKERAQRVVARSEIRQGIQADFVNVNVELRNCQQWIGLMLKDQIVVGIRRVAFLHSKIIPKILGSANAYQAVRVELGPQAGVHRRIVSDTSEYVGLDEVEVVIRRRGGVLSPR